MMTGRAAKMFIEFSKPNINHIIVWWQHRKPYLYDVGKVVEVVGLGDVRFKDLGDPAKPSAIGIRGIVTKSAVIKIFLLACDERN